MITLRAMMNSMITTCRWFRHRMTPMTIWFQPWTPTKWNLKFKLNRRTASSSIVNVPTKEINLKLATI